MKIIIRINCTVSLQLLVCMEVVHMALAWVPPSTMNPLLLLHCKVLRRLHLLVVAYFGVPQVCRPLLDIRECPKK